MDNSVIAARPPLLDEKNYSYWKVRVNVYIKVIDEKTWRAILTRWTHPTVTTEEVTTTKSEETWSKEKKCTCHS